MIIYLLYGSDSTLGEYEYVQQCLKLDLDIRLILCDVAKVPQSFKRTVSQITSQFLGSSLSLYI